MPGGPPVAIVHTRVRLEERLLLEALRRRGVPVVAVPDRELVFAVGGRAGEYACVLNRSMSVTRRHYVGHLFEAAGLTVINPAAVTDVCDDKVATAVRLAARGVPAPPSVVAIAAESGRAAIERVGYPAVVKPIDGSWGRLLARLNDRDAADAVLAHRQHLGRPGDRVVYAQRYIDKPGYDIRAVVVGDEVVGAIRRHADHWITNTAAGARSEPCEVGPELAKLCRSAAAAVGGGVLGIDVIESTDGEILVNEVNATPELRGFVDALGPAVVERIADFVVARPPT